MYIHYTSSTSACTGAGWSSIHSPDAVSCIFAKTVRRRIWSRYVVDPGLSYTALNGFLPDCSPGGSCQTSAPSIFGQGETWKSYEESMPSACDRSNSGNYAVRHNPAVYFTTLHGCSSDDVSYSHLATDLARNQLPTFSFITPNLIDDSPVVPGTDPAPCT
jgi:hypothetical protein